MVYPASAGTVRKSKTPSCMTESSFFAIQIMICTVPTDKMTNSVFDTLLSGVILQISSFMMVLILFSFNADKDLRMDNTYSTEVINVIQPSGRIYSFSN